MARLKVAINAAIQTGSWGGVESVLRGLVSSLGQLDDGDEEYVIITAASDADWIQEHLSANQRIVVMPGSKLSSAGTASRLKHEVKRGLSPIRPLAKKLLNASGAKTEEAWSNIPVSNGFYESLGSDVIHFPYQHFTYCALPSIFNPHDLQHRHMPQNFTAAQLARRESILPRACELAQTIAVASSWIKNDLIEQYGLSANKIQVIPWGAPTECLQKPSDENGKVVAKKYALKNPYVFYPAARWPHKNHARLLEAMALLRDRDGLRIQLVCSGMKVAQTQHQLDAQISRLKLKDQVQFLGFVPKGDLRILYKLSQFVIVPTLFEAASGPVYEAWAEGKPVACSTVTSLPEQVGQAALLFDPYSIQAIADAMKRMCQDSDLREDLAEKGIARLKDFNWQRTAKAYRAIYRRAANHTLSDEDSELLNWDWMKNPRPELDR